MIISILDLQIVNTELIPLTYFDPGSLSLVLWIKGFNDHCNSCPWKYAYDPENSLSQKHIDLNRILSTVSRRNIANIAFHGGDLLEHENSSKIISYIKTRRFRTIVKHRVTKPIDRTLILRSGIDAVVAEFSAADLDNSLLDRFRLLVESGIYVEALIVDLPQSLELPRVLRGLIEHIKAIDPYVPVNIYSSELREDYIFLVRKIVRDLCRNTCYIIENHLKIYPEHVYCRSCGKIVGKRIHNLIVDPIDPNSGKCYHCGYLNYRNLNKLRIKIPVVSKLHIA